MTRAKPKPKRLKPERKWAIVDACGDLATNRMFDRRRDAGKDLQCDTFYGERIARVEIREIPLKPRARKT